jgi:hypothetical protein
MTIPPGITINCFDYVIDVNAVNEDGEDVLADLDVSSLKNKKIETAIANTVEQIENSGYLNSDDSEILISAGTKSATHSEKLSRELETVITEDMGLPTRGVSVSQEDIERAHENGITAGRQWEHDNGAGNDEDMNNTPKAQNESGGQDNNRPAVDGSSGEMASAGTPADEKR